MVALGRSKVVVSTFPWWDEQRLLKLGTVASIDAISLHQGHEAIASYVIPAGGKRNKSDYTPMIELFKSVDGDDRRPRRSGGI